MIRFVLIILGCVVAFGGGVALSDRLLPAAGLAAAVDDKPDVNDIHASLIEIADRLDRIEQAFEQDGTPQQAELAARMQALETALKDVLDLNMEMIEAQ